ncbi:hypothetical protein C0Q70_18731 [Pomacea canaliculata]|uniref:Uncharacterized protein n=1 Tax=Pomacea canaliculata TaxID=400727 RepID=A0A2T7NHE4_POMCA|nr:uncharacterized protein LOC112577224 [Pomacea canaliculata]PVD20575.1 hypothetical protein C0Q70_18731 [Pomacea canaliculata]
MATAADSNLPQANRETKVSMADTPPPQYYPMAHPHTGGAPINTHNFMGMHVVQPHPTVMVTQPVVTVTKPATTCSLVMSVLSTIFCCFVCGIAGILVAWKARLHVLENKFDQARHSISIVWIFFGLALFFGLLTWGLSVYYIVLITSFSRYNK